MQIQNCIALYKLSTNYLYYNSLHFIAIDCTALPCPAPCPTVCSLGLIWSEIKQLWDVGLKEYISDMWNVVDFITNSLYVATIGLRMRAYYDVSHKTSLSCLKEEKLELLVVVKIVFLVPLVADPS